MATILLVGTSVAGEARAACWNAEEVTAASVRDLQSLMMVATLRCQAAGFGIAADYNRFLQANKTAIQAMNDRLKAHFIRASGPVAGQHDYDSFTTTLANAYGAGATNGEVCSGMATLAREAAMMAGSVEGLVLLAERQGLAPAMAGGACEAAPVVMAAAVPPAAAPEQVAVTAPVPAPPAMMLVAVPVPAPAPAQVAVATVPSAPAAVVMAAAGVR